VRPDVFHACSSSLIVIPPLASQALFSSLLALLGCIVLIVVSLSDSHRKIPLLSDHF
jgi:hypothetical protein